MAGVAGCRLQVMIDGVRSVQKPSPKGRSPSRSPFVTVVDLGTILLYPLEDRGQSDSVTSRQAPADAQSRLKDASKALSANPPKVDRAIRLLSHAVAEYPAYAVAWVELGRAHCLQQDYARALDDLLQARTADPQYFAIYPWLAGVALELRDWRRLQSAAAEWRQLRAGSQQAEYYLAIAYMNLGEFELAEAAATAVANGNELSRYPYVLYLLGTISARKGEISAAAGHFDQLLSLWPGAPMAAEVREQLTEWELERKIQPGDRPGAN
jgi:tetratricopeptide (TPR) repeat protein